MSPVAWAQAPSGSTPIGLWRSIDDQTGQLKAEIRLKANSAGVLGGVVEKAITPSNEPLCTEYADDRKGKPKLGLEIIRGAVKAGGTNPVGKAAPSLTRTTAAFKNCA